MKRENETIVKYLVEHGVNINKANEDGETPLFSAARNGAIIKYLVEHGVDINKVNSNGHTPSFMACISGNKTAIKYQCNDVTHKKILKQKKGENLVKENI